MSKRLLSQDQALRKIELSLKLQGKAFSPEFMTCKNCKFAWKNITGRDWGPTKETWRNHCAKYVNAPYHAYIRYKVVRKDAEGKVVYYPGAQRWDYETKKYVSTIKPGETDEMVFVYSSGRGVKKVCRRFEASGR
jgi:hypothetical protein